MKDLIDRQKAIRNICNEDCHQPTPCKWKCIAIEELEDLPSVQPWKWIPAKERLPKQQQTVLIQDFGEITIGYLNAENRWRNLTNLDDYLKGVVAWMPLPKPYEG